MEKNKKTYWPHMILGFLLVGVTLGYWTVKSASSIPVQESNEFMMKYQQADMSINDILKKKNAFDRQYRILLDNAKYEKLALENTKRAKSEKAVILNYGKNTFQYSVAEKQGNLLLKDANVSFLLTRPHTTEDDILRTHIPNEAGHYVIRDLNISKPGRYILQLKVDIDDNTIGYMETPAYLKP